MTAIRPWDRPPGRTRWVPRSPPAWPSGTRRVFTKPGSIGRRRTERPQPRVSAGTASRGARLRSAGSAPGSASADGHERVGAGRPAADQERPVRGLQGEQLAQRALAGAPAGRQHLELGRALAPGQAAGARRAPGRERPRLAPRRHRQRARERDRVADGVAERHDRHAPRLARVDGLRQPEDPLRPPVPQQLGVERADREAPARHARGHAPGEVVGVGAQLRARPLGVVRAAVHRPRQVAPRRVRVRVEVRPGGRVAGRAPDEVDDRAVDRRQHRAVRRAQGRQRVDPVVGEVDAGHAHARLRQPLVQPRRVRALRQPQAAVPVTEARPVRRDPRLELEADPGVGGQQRQHRVGGRRRPAHVRGERGHEVAAARLEVLGGRAVAGGGAVELRRDLRVRLDVQAVALGPDLVHERREALGHARSRQLVREHRRQRQRHAARALVEDVEQRQVARGDRLPQPLLAEGPRPEALHVGHVRVEDDREPAAHGRRTARKSSARSRSASPSRRSAKSPAAIAGVKRS